MESGNANLRSLACVCLAMQLLCSAVEASSLDDALIYASKHSAKADDDLIALASIPSISSLPEHLDDSRKAAQWLEKKLKRIGLQVSFSVAFCCWTWSAVCFQATALHTALA